MSCVPLPTPTCCRPPAVPRLPLVAFEVGCAWALGGFPSVFAGIFGCVGQKALKSVFQSHSCQEASPALPCVGPALGRAPQDHRLGVPRHPHSLSPGPRLGMGGTCRGGSLSPSHTLGHPASLGAAKFPLGLGGQLGTPPRGLQERESSAPGGDFGLVPGVGTLAPLSPPSPATAASSPPGPGSGPSLEPPRPLLGHQDFPP